MSTDANAALAWPIEVTEPATIGEQLVGRKKTPASVREIWGEPGGQGGELLLSLCGTSIPGKVEFSYSSEVAEGLWHERSRPEARMYWAKEALAWVCAPFIGSPESDPRVDIEGTETGAWLITPEDGPLGRPPWAPENHEAPMGGDGVYRADSK